MSGMRAMTPLQILHTNYQSSPKKEIDNLDSSIFIEEVEFVIKKQKQTNKNLPTKKTPDPDSFPGKFYKTLQEEKNDDFIKICSENFRAGNSFQFIL